MKQKRARGTGSIYKPKRSPFWWIAFHQSGKLIRESTGTDLKTVAQAKLTKRLEEINTNNFHPDTEKITVAEIYAHVLSDYTKNNRPTLGTLKGRWHTDHSGHDRRGSRTTLREFFGHLRANQVTYTLLERYQVQRIAEGGANGSVNRELNVLKKAFRYALQAGEVKVVPPFPKSLKEKVRDDFITDEDYPRFAAACLEVGGLWFRAMFECAYSFGTRKTELLHLKVGSVNLMERTITLSPNETKTEKGRLLPMVDDGLFDLIEACVQGKQDGDFVFTREGKPIKNFRDRWLTVCRLAGKTVRYHGLRRSACTAMINAGIPPKEVMAISGHSSLSVFTRYHIVEPKSLRATMAVLAAKRAENLQKIPANSHHVHTDGVALPQPSDESMTSKSIQ
jgi:integrase